MGKQQCCFIGEAGDERPSCQLDAEWKIDSPGFEDETFSCTDHVGALLGDAPIYVITPEALEGEKYG